MLCLENMAFQVVLVVKNPPANAGEVRDAGSIPGQEDPLEKGMATHCSILAWEIPRTEEPGGYSPWGCKESDITKQLTFTFNKNKYLQQTLKAYIQKY